MMIEKFGKEEGEKVDGSGEQNTISYLSLIRVHQFSTAFKA